MLAVSFHIQTERLSLPKNSILLQPSFLFQFWALFAAPLPFSRKHSRAGQKRVVLVACYECASDGWWAAFAGKEKLLPFSGKVLPPWATLPRP